MSSIGSAESDVAEKEGIALCRSFGTQIESPIKKSDDYLTQFTKKMTEKGLTRKVFNLHSLGQ